MQTDQKTGAQATDPMTGAEAQDPVYRRRCLQGSLSGDSAFCDNEYLGFFVVAILITIYSEIWARVLKTPATTI